VTFALFSYNQERFIREAVAGAFAQTYTPLEIILSDDGSSDRTFEIMRELCAAYGGPHRVVLNRTECNLGTFQHVVTVGKLARGELVVVAAGDDISKPERCDVLYRCWSSTGASALCSDHDVIDGTGRLVQRNGGFPTFSAFQRYLDTGGGRPTKILQGSTAAYARNVLDIDVRGFPKAFAEDNIINFMLVLRGERIEHVEEALVLYREHGAALHHRPNGADSWTERERHTVESARKNLSKMQIFRRILERERKSLAPVGRRRFRDDERRLTDIVEWPQLSLRARIGRIMRSARAGNPKAVAWMMLRLFGSVDRYQPGKVVYSLILDRPKVLGRH
jgi:hypothetical protein